MLIAKCLRMLVVIVWLMSIYGIIMAESLRESVSCFVLWIVCLILFKVLTAQIGYIKKLHEE